MEKMCYITKLGAEGMQVYRVEKNIYTNVPYIRVVVGVACQMEVERKIPSCVKILYLLVSWIQ